MQKKKGKCLSFFITNYPDMNEKYTSRKKNTKEHREKKKNMIIKLIQKTETNIYI